MAKSIHIQTTTSNVLLDELRASLYSSSAAQRQTWTQTIINQQLDLRSFFVLLTEDKKIAVRFMWFLSELGTLSPATLKPQLPYLFNLCEPLAPILRTSFPSFWLITGVPTEQETTAIDLLFQYALSPETNVTIKSRAIIVLQGLCKKYPDLKNELVLCIEDQKEKYSKDFEKRMLRILKEIKSE